MVLSASPGPADPVDGFEDFFRGFQSSPKTYKYRKEISQVYSQGGTTLVFLFEDLMAWNPHLAQELRENPESILEDAVTAFKNLLRIEAGGVIDEDVDYFVRVSEGKGVCEIPLRGLRARHIDKLVHVHGILTRSSQIRPQLVTATFECDVCHAQIEVEQLQSKITRPMRCASPACTNRKSFTLLGSDSRFIDWQSINIQELQEELPPGRTPSNVQIILTHDLVDRVRPGDRVRVMGTWKSVPVESGRGQASTIFRTFIKANNVESLEEEREELYPTDEEIKEIKRLAKEKGIQRKIARSIASTIYGRKNLKMATALSLFGGVTKVKSNGMRIRGDIHVLFVGDPGTGKSQILRSAARVAPRAVYASGKGSSGVGLTAAVVKDQESGAMTLEAGAMVLADSGIACIDEFDKMRKDDRSAIHEAMEQQTVSIAKAGIVATLNCRTSILAAANPHFGRYNPNKTVAENIRLPPPILSRFDLIFVVRDVPDSKEDQALADFIIDLHMQDVGLPSHEDVVVKEDGTCPDLGLSAGGDAEASDDYIPVDLLRKYIKYARKHCHPVLTPPAADKIKEFYLKLRGQGDGGGPLEGGALAIVARTLEGIIRLSEAYAKMALRDKVLEEDVDAVLELVRESIKDLTLDPVTGQMDVDRIIGNTSNRQAKVFQKILDLLKDMEEMNNGAPVRLTDLQELCLLEGIPKDQFDESMDNLHKKGDVIYPKTGYVKRTPSF